MGFCENCGKELAEGEQCTCTTADVAVQEPVAEEAPVAEAPVVETAPIAEEAPAKEQKPAKSNKMFIGVIAVVAVVLILVIALIAGGSKGYMGPVENFMKEINKKNTDPVEVVSTLMPDFAADLFAQYHKKLSASEDYVEYYEDGIKELEDYYDDCDDEYDKWKLSFELKKASKLDEDDLEEIQDYLDDYYDNYWEDSVDYIEDGLDDDDAIEDAAEELDISESQAKAIMKANLKYLQVYEEMKVTAGYEVKGKFIVKSGKDEYDTKTVEFRVVKINGDWTYWGITSGSMNFDGDDEGCFNFIENFLSSRYLHQSFYY